MSMMPPPFSADPSGEEIAAAEPGTGAPPSAPGFGVRTGEPDVNEEGPADDAAPTAEPPSSTPFRTPDPRELGPRD
jgi:predicted component of type VI protein secretion system